MLRVMTIVGARPQFIKAAAVSDVISSRADMTEILVHTGQHYDDNMSSQFFTELGIPEPVLNLGIGSGSHGEQTGRMLAALDEAMGRERPDQVLVYGDTNSTLAGALAAAKLHIPVAHVEAGLRSGNRCMPEEINRIVADHACDLLFAPTVTAVANLAREGLDTSRVALVGDVMYDVALRLGAKARQGSDVLARLGVRPDGYIVATVHRAETTDHPARLAAVLRGLGAVIHEMPVVLPLHPRTRKRAFDQGLAFPSGLIVIEPVGYLDMTALVCQARLVATDSGGLQKEAYFHGVPCVTLRAETEWTELVALGWNRLVPPESADAVAAAVHDGLNMPLPNRPEQEPYGDGRAADRIAAALGVAGSA